MESKPLVTCIVPTYNNTEFLFEALDSILIQTYNNIELIISDDASTAFDKASVIAYIEKNSKNNLASYLVIQNEINLGTTKHFNSIIAKSSGKYILFLSCDDLFFDELVIEKIVSFFEKEHCLIATAFREVYTQDLKNLVEKVPNAKDLTYLAKKPLALYNRLCFGNFISGACTYYTRAVIEKYQLFDEEYVLLEDYPSYLKLSRQEVKITFMPFTTIKYRLGGVSTNTQNINSPRLNKDLAKIFDKEIKPYKHLLGVNYIFLKLLDLKAKLSIRKRIKLFLNYFIKDL